MTFEEAYRDKIIVEIESIPIPVLSKDKVDAETLINS